MTNPDDRLQSLYESGPLVSVDGCSVGSIGVIGLAPPNPDEATLHINGRQVVHADRWVIPPDLNAPVAADMVGERSRNALETAGARDGAPFRGDSRARTFNDPGAPSAEYFEALAQRLNDGAGRAAARFPDHRRRTGARTLGGWRRIVALPEVLLDVFVGGERTGEELTRETTLALGFLGARQIRSALAA
jgi:hypothetical protein